VTQQQKRVQATITYEFQDSSLPVMFSTNSMSNQFLVPGDKVQFTAQFDTSIKANRDLLKAEDDEETLQWSISEITP
jgi:hypothetical protein